MKRFEDWELKLHNFIDERAGEPFQWGVNDCALFVCDGIEAMTGVDVATAFRGQYHTLAGAVVRMQEVAGGPTIEHVAVHVTNQYGMPELATVKLAQRGDVVLFDGKEGPALGLVSLDGVNAVFVGDEGLRRLPVLECRRAWRV